MASGDPVKMAMVNVESKLPPGKRFEQLSLSLTSLLPYLSVRNACINLAFLVFYKLMFLFFFSYFPLFSAALQILSLFVDLGLVILPLVAIYRSSLLISIFKGTEIDYLSCNLIICLHRIDMLGKTIGCIRQMSVYWETILSVVLSPN